MPPSVEAAALFSFAPGAEEVARASRASRAMDVGQSGGGAVSLDGEGMDAPVLPRAQRVLLAGHGSQGGGA